MDAYTCNIGHPNCSTKYDGGKCSVETVDRFDCVTSGGYDGYGEMEQDNEFGDWVNYDDYVALQKQLDAVKAQLAVKNERPLV